MPIYDCTHPPRIPCTDTSLVERPQSEHKWEEKVSGTVPPSPLVPVRGLTTACRRRLPASARTSLPLPAAPDAQRWAPRGGHEVAGERWGSQGPSRPSGRGGSGPTSGVAVGAYHPRTPRQGELGEGARRPPPYAPSPVRAVRWPAAPVPRPVVHERTMGVTPGWASLALAPQALRGVVGGSGAPSGGLGVAVPPRRLALACAASLGWSVGLLPRCGLCRGGRPWWSRGRQRVVALEGSSPPSGGGSQAVRCPPTVPAAASVLGRRAHRARQSEPGGLQAQVGRHGDIPRGHCRGALVGWWDGLADGMDLSPWPGWALRCPQGTRHGASGAWTGRESGAQRGPTTQWSRPRQW